MSPAPRRPARRSVRTSRLSRLALLAALSGGCDSSSTRSDSRIWDWDAGCPPDTICETFGACTFDGGASNDPGTLTMPIDTLELPVSSDPTVMAGLDIDGQATSYATDPAGCFAKDTRQSASTSWAKVDNGVALSAPLLAPLGLDLSQAFAAAVDRSGGATPSLDATLRLEHWNGTPTDLCVALRVERTGAASNEVVTALSGGLSPVTRFGSSSIPLLLHLVRSGCTPNAAFGITCEADVHVTIENVLLRIGVQTVGDTTRLVTNRPLENEATAAPNPSLLGGSIRFWDQESYATRRTCGDGLANGAGTLADELAAAAPKLGLDSAGALALCQAFAAHLDLRLPPPSAGGSTAPIACEAAGTSPTGGPNAISIGLYVGSGYVVPTTKTP